MRFFHERYPEVAVAKTRLMPDVPEVLGKLASRVHPMAVASNKPARGAGSTAKPIASVKVSHVPVAKPAPAVAAAKSEAPVAPVASVAKGDDLDKFFQ